MDRGMPFGIATMRFGEPDNLGGDLWRRGGRDDCGSFRLLAERIVSIQANGTSDEIEGIITFCFGPGQQVLSVY